MGKFTAYDFIREQYAKVPPVATADLSGKTVMVIGANTGLGFEASKHFAGMNPTRLILACRSEEKGKFALEKLQNETGYKSAELWLIDLSQFSSVTAFGDRFEKDGGRLDILVENAACAPVEYEATPDGWESTLQVNCLSTSLLGLRLLPQMVDTGRKYGTRPRLVVVTSEVHYWAKLEKQILNGHEIYKKLGEKEYCTPNAMSRRYFDSKLFNICFYQELNERFPNSPVVFCGVNPGYCYSGIRRSFGGVKAALSWVMDKALARTTEEGGRQLTFAAAGDVGEEDRFRGAYISAGKISEASDFVIGSEGKVLQQKLWDEMMDILSKADPRVKDVENKYLSSLPSQ